MNAVNFEYDGQNLSDFGFIVCDFNYSNGVVSASSGSKITFEKISRNKGKKYSLINTRYDECISAQFDICKNPDIYDYEEREIKSAEYRELMRWLNRREFLKFQILYDDNREPCFYNVSFNIEKITICEKLYGLRLTMESDSPFGYGQEEYISLDFSDASKSKIINYTSDEIGYIYPDMEITCKQNGELSITNELSECTMIIKNCSAKEVITIKGNAQIISSDFTAHKINNDFNYNFFKLGNTYNNSHNPISVSIPCEIIIKYSPIIKDTP